MALVPVRNIGQYGVNTDVDPLDLPLAVFNYAANVRFVDNKVSRGPVFAHLGVNAENTAPRWAYGFRLQGESSTFLVMAQDGTVASVAPGSPGSPLTRTPMSPAGYTPATLSVPYTATVLSNVMYANRNDRVPWSLTPGSSTFTDLPNWNATWRCQSLRSFNGCLVALNVTKGATVYPTMVKTSDFAPFGSVPATWTASTTNSATENVLSDMVDPIVDGWPLRERFIIYGTNETWVMTPSDDSFIYNYQRLFSNYGMLTQNCVAEVNNQHFVFGTDDIWVHDGFTPKSLASSRVRKFVFNYIVKSQAYQSFVWYRPNLNEVLFCYVSTDPYCAFPVNPSIGYPGCNRAAAYNWLSDTWTFYDLPYIVGGAQGLMYGSGTAGLTYPDFGSVTYDTVSGAYQAVEDTSSLYNLAVGRGGSVSASILPLQTTGSWVSGTHLYSYELQDTLVGLGTVVDVVNAPVYLENVQMDMDEVAKELRGYKVVTSVYPAARMDNQSNPMTFWYGGSDYSNQTPQFSPSMTFNGDTQYKLDFNSPGRYLTFKVAMGNPVQKFSWTGMDLEFKVFGHR